MANNSITNIYSWNKTLKFSWGHIIAFIAIIFYSYVSYMGAFYYWGSFWLAALVVSINDVALLCVFLGAQVLKGIDHKFNRNIIYERLLIIISPLVFIASLIPFNHFWGVYSLRHDIETQFNNSIVGAKQMFYDYDAYANKRVANFSAYLDERGTDSPTTKENYLLCLRLQLLSQNTDSIKALALEWIDNANQGATVWNAFLVGNVGQISTAIQEWHQILVDYSRPRLRAEPKTGKYAVSSFETNQQAYEQALDGITQLSIYYGSLKGVKFNTIWTGLILYVMLLVPYIVQKRNVRAQGYFGLFPTKSKVSHQGGASNMGEASYMTTISPQLNGRSVPSTPLQNQQGFPPNVASESTSNTSTKKDKDIFGTAF